MPSIGFMSHEVTGEQMVTSHRADALMYHDPAWFAWWSGKQPWFLWIEDREKTYRRLTGDTLRFAVSVDRLHAAEREGRLVAEWLTIYGEMADYWTRKKGGDPPPPLPDPDGALPPRAEAFQAEIAAGYVLRAVESDVVAETLEAAEDDPQ